MNALSNMFKRIGTILLFPLTCSLFPVLALSSCSDPSQHEDVLAKWPWTDPEPQPDPDPDPTPVDDANPALIENGWTNVSSTFGSLPSYLNVYLSPDEIDGDKTIAYIAVADMSGAQLEFLGDITNEGGTGTSTGLYTPTEFYNQYDNPWVVINGGLFFEDSGKYYSQNALYRDYQCLSANQTYYSEDWVNFWYPTLGMFYQKADGTFATCWTYYNWTGIDYGYDTCKTIDKSRYDGDGDVPSATYPSAAFQLNDGKTVKQGIGGVGVLIHNGTIVNTWADELLDISADAQHPRTAIGYDATNNKVFFFVCEGRQMTEGVAGKTLQQEAEILFALGCSEALNLDGGGSSCMLVNGKETIKSSDGHERSVIDACAIR